MAAKSHPESTAPKEGVPCVHLSVRGLVRPGGAAEASSLQLPEGLMSFISFCEVA